MKQVLIPLILFTACTIIISCEKEPGCKNCESNKPPIANAGTDQTITLPANSVTLDGSGSTDPDNNIASYAWRRISGPLQFTIANANAVQTNVTNLLRGIYLFELKVTDAGGLVSKDTVQVTVSTVLPNTLSNDTIIVISGTATLTPFGSLSQAKNVVPAIAADKLVFAGGYLKSEWDSEPTATVDIYNLSANTWSTAKLSEARSGMTVATVGNKILYAGGFGNTSTSSRVDIYDAAANTWTTAQLSMARGNMTTAVAGNKAFFAGSDYYPFTSRVDIYDASANSWSTASLSEARNGMSVVTAGNKVFFAGGFKRYEGLDEVRFDFSTRVDIYDIAANTWTTAELKEARTGMAAAVAANKVMFAGGYYTTDPGTGQQRTFNRVDIYDVSANAWSTDTLSVARQGMVAATVGDKVLFAGGGKSKVDIYDAATNSWSEALLSQPRGVSSTVTLGNKVLFFTGDPHYNRMDIYDASANTWSWAELNKSLISNPIAAGNTVFIGGGTVHTIGTYTDAHFMSNVWKLQF